MPLLPPVVLMAPAVEDFFNARPLSSVYALWVELADFSPNVTVGFALRPLLNLKKATERR